MTTSDAYAAGLAHERNADAWAISEALAEAETALLDDDRDGEGVVS